MGTKRPYNLIIRIITLFEILYFEFFKNLFLTVDACC